MKLFMDHLGSPSWVVRRRIVILSLLWICGLVTYLAIFGSPTSLTEAIATNLILLFGGIVGSYVFGAVWDQKTKPQEPAIPEYNPVPPASYTEPKP